MSVQLPVQLASSYRPATASYPPSSPASSYMYRSRPDGGQAGRLVAVLETCSRPRGSAAGSVCVWPQCMACRGVLAGARTRAIARRRRIRFIARPYPRRYHVE